MLPFCYLTEFRLAVKSNPAYRQGVKEDIIKRNAWFQVNQGRSHKVIIVLAVGKPVEGDVVNALLELEPPPHAARDGPPPERKSRL